MEDIISIAIKKGWIVNPNKTIVNAIINGQNKLFGKYGNYFCPCELEKFKKIYAFAKNHKKK